MAEQILKPRTRNDDAALTDARTRRIIEIGELTANTDKNKMHQLSKTQQEPETKD